MPEKNYKSLVAFLDFMGTTIDFDVIYLEVNGKDEATRYQASQEYLKKFHYRQDVAERSLADNIQLLSKTIRPEILQVEHATISDSLIVVFKNLEERHLHTAMRLLGAFISSVVTEYLANQDTLKGGIPLIHPIRGGVAYDYGEVNLNHSPIVLAGFVWDKVVRLEKKASWPRVIIDPDLASKVASSQQVKPFLDDSDPEFLSFDLQGIGIQTIQNQIPQADRAKMTLDFIIAKSFQFIDLNLEKNFKTTKYLEDKGTPISGKELQEIVNKYQRWIIHHNLKTKMLAAKYKIDECHFKEFLLPEVLDEIIIQEYRSR